MKRTYLPYVALVGAAACLASAHAQVIVSEDFESYSTTAEMTAVWQGGPATLDGAFGNGGQSAFHPGGTVNAITGMSLAPTATHNILLTADIYDDATSANERLTVGLRNGANPLFEVGHYNAPGHYATRILNFGGNENWVAFDLGEGGNVPQEGWNRYQALFTLDNVTVSLDLGADGSVESTVFSEGAFSANPFTEIRFGGPSNLSSAGGGANFDNIQLELVLVPEPGTVSMLVIGALGMFCVCRRRS